LTAKLLYFYGLQKGVSPLPEKQFQTAFIFATSYTSLNLRQTWLVAQPNGYVSLRAVSERSRTAWPAIAW